MFTAWTPPPHVAEAYKHYFGIADVGKTGQVGGPAVVAFLRRSKLDRSILKEVRHFLCVFVSLCTSIHPFTRTCRRLRCGTFPTAATPAA